MAKITKISDKLVKAGESVTVYFYDNAFMVESAGRDANDDWCTVKLVCADLSEVQTLLLELESLPRDS